MYQELLKAIKLAGLPTAARTEVPTATVSTRGRAVIWLWLPKVPNIDALTTSMPTNHSAHDGI